MVAAAVVVAGAAVAIPAVADSATLPTQAAPASPPLSGASPSHHDELIPPSMINVPTSNPDDAVAAIVLTPTPNSIVGTVVGAADAEVDLTIMTGTTERRETVTATGGSFTVATNGDKPVRVVARSGPASAMASNRTTASLAVNVDTDGATPSQTTASLTARATNPGGGSSPEANVALTFTLREPSGTTIRRTATTGIDGEARIRIPVWRNPTLTVNATKGAASAATTLTVPTTPVATIAAIPSGAPQPRVPYPLTSPPAGTRARAVVSRIPAAVWRSMRGLSWRPGCVGRGELRLLTTNYIGFDGYRHRGSMVLSRYIASKMVTLFTHMHNVRFPIRHMRPVDVYGRNELGRPGANDYKSMAADNTSAFNCRYVVGREQHRVRSPHATGRSVDINPWENPYVAPNGVFPNTHFLRRSPASPGMLTSNSATMALARQLGCRWGGGYADFHHFDC